MILWKHHLNQNINHISWIPIAKSLHGAQIEFYCFDGFFSSPLAAIMLFLCDREIMFIEIDLDSFNPLHRLVLLTTL